MALKKNINPDSITLGDVRGMSTNEFRQWNFFRLNSIEGKLKGHDRRFDKLDNRIWMVMATIIVSMLLAILASLAG